MAFNNAIYTDVTEDESVDLVAGFGFQSRSEEIGGAEQSVIVEKMLHSNSSSWGLEREETDHPATIAYLPLDGKYFFSKGKSTGKTNSGRRGNQLTEIAVTTTADDITPYVPAQIFASSVWRVEKREDPNDTQWFAPVDIPADFEQGDLIEWVQETPQRRAFLAKLTASLDAREEKKTVLITRDMDEVIRWFALGSIMLGAEEALKLPLRGFVENPFNANAPFTAVHPDLLPSRLEGANVFDVDTLTPAEIELTAAANICLKWIENHDGYDALESIARFRSWEPALGAELAAAATTMLSDDDSAEAEAVQKSKGWPVGIGVIRGLAKAELFDDLELYGDELTEALRGHQPQTCEEFVDAATATGFSQEINIDGLTESILDATMGGLFNHPESAGEWAKELIANPDWTWDGYESFQEQVLQLLTHVETVDEKSSLLTLVSKSTRALPREHLDQYVAPVAEVLRQYELSNPGYFKDCIHSWPDAERIIQDLRKQLVSQLKYERSRIDTLQPLLSGKWDYLRAEHPVNKIENEFNHWLAASQIGRVPLVQRHEAVSQHAHEVKPELWRLALHGAQLPTNTDLFTEWATYVEADDDFTQTVTDQVKLLLESDPTKHKPRDADPWIDLVEAMNQTSSSETTREILSWLRAWKDEVPTLRDKAVKGFGEMTKMFGRKKKSQDNNDIRRKQ